MEKLPSYPEGGETPEWPVTWRRTDKKSFDVFHGPHILHYEIKERKLVSGSKGDLPDWEYQKVKEGAIVVARALLKEIDPPCEVEADSEKPSAEEKEPPKQFELGL